MDVEPQRLRLLLILLLAFAGVAGAAAQDDDENAVVGQTLSWEGNEDALRYELIIVDASDKELLHQSTENTSVELKLKPGAYRYKVLVYNVLDQLEVDTAWNDLVVIRAEIPGPKKVTPNIQYLENPVLRFRVEGLLLVEGAQYRLFRQDKPEIATAGQVVSHLSDEEVELTFPDFEFSYGDYSLTIENPGGLKHTLKNALFVRYDKPVDFHLSVGYAPGSVVYDSWYQSTWNQGFYPWGATGRLTVLFLKKGEYQLGAEAEGNAWLQTGGTPEAIINSKYLSAGVNAVYHYLVTKQLRLTARLGGGLMAGFHAFDYQGTPGLAWSSLDPYVDASVGVFYSILKFWHVEADVGILNGFGNQYSAGLVRPSVLTGVNF